MPHIYVCYRCWRNFSPTFPADKFTALPDDQIDTALDTEATAILNKHPERLKWLNESRRRAILGSPHGDGVKVTATVLEDVPLERLDAGRKMRLAGWFSANLIHTSEYHRRRIVLGTDSKAIAETVTNTLNLRFKPDQLRPHFSYFSADGFSLEHTILLDRQADGVDPASDGVHLTQPEIQIYWAARDVARRAGVLTSQRQLGDAEQNVLEALTELCATDRESRKSAKEIAKATVGEADENKVKHPLADLAKRGFVDSTGGRRGGSWITPLGTESLKQSKTK
jgi:hypothetical protein